MALAGETARTVTALLRRFLTFIFVGEKRFPDTASFFPVRLFILDCMPVYPGALPDTFSPQRCHLLIWLGPAANYPSHITEEALGAYPPAR